MKCHVAWVRTTLSTNTYYTDYFPNVLIIFIDSFNNFSSVRVSLHIETRRSSLFSLFFCTDCDLISKRNDFHELFINLQQVFGGVWKYISFCINWSFRGSGVPFIVKIASLFIDTQVSTIASHVPKSVKRAVRSIVNLEPELCVCSI